MLTKLTKNGKNRKPVKLSKKSQPNKVLGNLISYEHTSVLRMNIPRSGYLIWISPAMNALSTLSPPHISAFHPNKTSPFLHPTKTPTQTIVQPLLGFCSLKPLRTSTPNHSPHFPASYKFPRSLFPSEPQLSDDFEDEDDDDDDDGDDEEAADEYDDVPGEVLDGGELSEEDEVESPVDDDDGALEGKPVFEEFKWQRVERVLNEVREFGEEIIDEDELASIYNFRIDKFQVIFTFWWQRLTIS